jgi:hypothetical protein
MLPGAVRGSFKIGMSAHWVRSASEAALLPRHVGHASTLRPFIANSYDFIG